MTQIPFSLLPTYNGAAPFLEKAITVRKLGFLALLCLLILTLLTSVTAAQTAPTFVGVRTFLSAPYQPDIEKIQADFAVLGVPFDEGTWGQPGERYGPRDMRENSQEYAHDLTEGFYYIDGDRTVLKGKRWVDVGDVVIYPTVAEQTNAKVTEAVKKDSREEGIPDYSRRRPQHHLSRDSRVRHPADRGAHRRASGYLERREGKPGSRFLGAARGQIVQR